MSFKCDYFAISFYLVFAHLRSKTHACVPLALSPPPSRSDGGEVNMWQAGGKPLSFRC